MPVKYKENELKLRRLKGRLLNKLGKLEESQATIVIEVDNVTKNNYYS